MPASSRYSLVLLLLIGVLAALLASAVRDVWTLDPDAAAYVSLGRSLAQGQGYVLDGMPHGKYPPGLPVLLSLLMKPLGLEAYAAFHLSLVACLLLAVLGSAQLARQWGLSEGAALTLAAAVGFSQTLFDLSVRYLRTEVLFLALTVWAAVWLNRALSPHGRVRTALVAGLLIAAASATRLAGITLLVVPCWHLLRPATAGSRRRAGLALALGALFVACWLGRGQLLRTENPDAPDYTAEFTAAAPRDLTKTVPVDMPAIDAAGLVRRVTGNVRVLARASGVLLTNVDRSGELLAVGAALALAVLIGLATCLRGVGSLTAGRERQDAGLYLLATLALYLLWPFNQQERFYAPLLPWLLMCAGLGATLLWSRARTLSRHEQLRWLLPALAALILLALALRRSDHPVVFGRWSTGYSATLALLALAVAALAGWLRRAPLPALGPAALLAVVFLFAGAFAQERGLEWPAQVAAFEAHRQSQPTQGPRARIEVNPILEQVAAYLETETPEGAVLMTDVPKMLSILSGRRCVPFRYRISPPGLVTDGADLLFYTRELPELSALVDDSAASFPVALQLPPISDGNVTVRPVVYSLKR